MVIENGWKYYTPKEAAELLGTSRKAVYAMIANGKLEATRTATHGRFWITEDELIRVTAYQVWTEKAKEIIQACTA